MGLAADTGVDDPARSPLGPVPLVRSRTERLPVAAEADSTDAQNPCGVSGSLLHRRSHNFPLSSSFSSRRSSSRVAAGLPPSIEDLRAMALPRSKSGSPKLSAEIEDVRYPVRRLELEDLREALGRGSRAQNGRRKRRFFSTKEQWPTAPPSPGHCTFSLNTRRVSPPPCFHSLLFPGDSLCTFSSWRVSK
jgi:hypothetical protein